MALKSRGVPFIVPTYSLTGDILSFERCGLQYRYYNGSSLPPSRPVQMWTGEFTHGVLEEAYRCWNTLKDDVSFPWPCSPEEDEQVDLAENDIRRIGSRIEKQLLSKGMGHRSSDVREIAYSRVETAINVLGPELFPLIDKTEERISGVRKLQYVLRGGGDRYELTGIADVISSVSLYSQLENPIVQMIKEIVSNLGDRFDIIVDYKAARRPANNSKYWKNQEWQIQTYSWLKNKAPNTIPVKAGIIIYINELLPSKNDIQLLKNEISEGNTDVVPERGSEDYYALFRWNGDRDEPLPVLSQELKFKRALRIIDTSTASIDDAVFEIDNIVLTIEKCAQDEISSGNIFGGNWPAIGESNDCVACDFKHFCPAPSDQRTKNPQVRKPPVAPG